MTTVALGAGDHSPVTTSRFASRRAAMAVLARSSPGLTTLMLGLGTLTGAMSAVFAVAIGALVGAVPAAIGHGFSSPAGHRIVWALAAMGGVTLVEELAVSGMGLVSNELYARFDEHVLARIMRATLSPAWAGHLDDPEIQRRITLAKAAARFGPGEFVSGLSTKWVARVRGLAALVVIGRASIWYSLGIALVWLVYANRMSVANFRLNPYWAEPMRRAIYIRELGLEAAAAKEVRIFGLADWLGDRYLWHWGETMRHLWAARRVDHWTMVPVAGLVLGVHVWVLEAAVSAGIGHRVSLSVLSAMLAALVTAAQLGSLDGDIWVENGAVPVPSVLELERTLSQLPTGGRQPAALQAPHRSIRLAGLRFSYPAGAEEVLRGVDLDIPAGSSLALVGDNGAGKTTLVSLLAGVLPPNPGQVLVDGVDLAELEPASWRRQVAAIFQDFTRFEASLRTNLLAGAADLQLPDEVLLDALAKAGGAELLDRLPHGLETVLSRRFPGGVELSGGQWQRVALARALVAVARGARLLILDEPTAQLDVRGEAELFDRFLDITAGSSVVLVSHRFSTVRRADRIAVLAEGRIAELGSHDELLAAEGRYARMFRLQAERFHG